MLSFLKTKFAPKNQAAENPPPTTYEDPTVPLPQPPPPPPRSPLLDQITDRTKKLLPKVVLRNILPGREQRRGETPSLEGQSYGTAEGQVNSPTAVSLPSGDLDSLGLTGARTPPQQNEPSPPPPVTASDAPPRTSPPSSGSSRELPVLPSERRSPPRGASLEEPPPRPSDEVQIIKTKAARRKANHFSLTEEIIKSPDNGLHEIPRGAFEFRRGSPPKVDASVTVERKISPAIRVSEVVEEEAMESLPSQMYQQGVDQAEEDDGKVEELRQRPILPVDPSHSDEIVRQEEEAKKDEPVEPGPREEPRLRRTSTLVYPNLHYFDDIGKEKDAIEITKDIYVEERKSFRRTRRNVLESAMRQATEDREAQGILETAALKSVTHAIAFQTALNLFSLMLQGFLSGLAVAHTVFAYVFADRELLLRGYRWMSLPVHATFMVCFILGIMAAADRVRWQEFSFRKIRTWINAFGGMLQLIPMVIGLAASEMSLYFDESLAPAIRSPAISESSISTWRILSFVRAACAVFSWISVAFQPTNTAILEHLGVFMLPEEVRDAHDFYKESGDGALAESRIPKAFGGVLDQATKNMMNRLGVTTLPSDMSVLLTNAPTLSSNPTDLPQSIPAPSSQP